MEMTDESWSLFRLFNFESNFKSDFARPYKIMPIVFLLNNALECINSLYYSIKTEPFKIPEDDGNDLMHTFFNPDKEGWLCKQGGRCTNLFSLILD